VQWSVVLSVLSIRPSLFAKQELNNIAVTFEGCQMQWGPSICTSNMLTALGIQVQYCLSLLQANAAGYVSRQY